MCCGKRIFVCRWGDLKGTKREVNFYDVSFRAFVGCIKIIGLGLQEGERDCYFMMRRTRSEAIAS